GVLERLADVHADLERAVRHHDGRGVAAAVAPAGARVLAGLVADTAATRAHGRRAVGHERRRRIARRTLTEAHGALDHRALDHVAQLAHVARPVVLHHELHRLRSQRRDLTAGRAGQ